MTIEVKEFETLKYIVRYPKGYIEGEKYPVVIYLHGAGSRGDSIEPSKNSVFMNYTEEYPFVSIAPQCDAETWFDVFEQLKRLVMKVVCEKFADEERIYLTGASMGGYTCWMLSILRPNLFAAAVICCGGGTYWSAHRIKFPVIAVHGLEDTTVLPRESEIMVEKINQHGGNAQMISHEKLGHNVWQITFNDRNIYKWLYEQKKKCFG